jgi:hypothetical protein
MSDTPRMKTVKQMYEAMANEPTRPSAGHTSKPMNMADKMFTPAKKMAKGGVTRADGCVTKGHTKGKMV